MQTRAIRTVRRSWLELFQTHCGGIAAVAAALAVAVMLLLAWLSPYGARQLDDGASVDGQIVAYVPLSSFDQRSKIATFVYQFAGKSYETRAQVSERYYYLHPVGENVTLYLMDSDPAAIRNDLIELKRADRFGFVSLWVVVFVSSAVMAWAALQTTNAIRARRSGRPGTGRIDEIEAVFALHPKQIMGKTTYGRFVFVDNFGRKCRSFAHPLTTLDQWEIGEHINVYAGDKSSWWEGDVGVRRTTFGATKVSAAATR